MGAVDYDLMTLTRWTVDDIAGALPWARLRRFLSNLPTNSATMRELSGMRSAWIDGGATAEMLAQIYDLLAMFRHEHAVSKIPKNKTRPKPPERHQRPVVERRDEQKAPFDYEALRARLYETPITIE